MIVYVPNFGEVKGQRRVAIEGPHTMSIRGGVVYNNYSIMPEKET